MFHDSLRAGGTIRGPVDLYPRTISENALDIIGLAGQTADLLRVRNSAGVDLFTVQADGDVTVLGNIISVDAYGGANLVLTGYATVGDYLTVTGATTLSSTLSVTGAATLLSHLTVSGNLVQSGEAQFGSYVSFNPSGALFIGQRSTDPPTRDNQGSLYTKDTSNVAELFYKDDTGAVTQITSGGALGGDDVFIPDDKYLKLGNTTAAPDAILGWNTTQTVDAVYLGLSATQNTLILAEKADYAYDFAHGAQTNPTLFIQSANQSATQWGSLVHDQTDFVLASGAGAVHVKPVANSSLKVTTSDTNTTGTSVYGSYFSHTSSAVITGTNHFLYGQYVNVEKTGASTSTDTINLYGAYYNVSHTGSGVFGTRNTYGIYASATADTAGTSSAYGIYATATGGDNNYAGYFSGTYSIIALGLALFSSSQQTTTVFNVTNTYNGSSVPVATFQGDRATFTDNDEAYISLKLSNDSGTGVQTEFARLTWVATDVSSGTEDGRIDFSTITNGALAPKLSLNGQDLSPYSSDLISLGTTSLMWSDLFLASGAVINFNAGDVTLTHSANTLAFAGATVGYTYDSNVAVTVANTANVVGLTVTQNDTTNNPMAVSVTNAGTGNAVRITSTGNMGTSDSTGGALLITNTAGTGMMLNLYTKNNVISTAGGLFRANAAPADTTTVDGAQTIDTTSTSITVADTTDFESTGTLRVINNTSDGESNDTFYLVYTGKTPTTFTGVSPGFYVKTAATNVINNAVVQYVDTVQTFSLANLVDCSANGGAVNLKLTGCNPDIEFIAKGGYNNSIGQGKFEIDVPVGTGTANPANIDCLRINGRNDANSSFAVNTIFSRPGATGQGMVGVGFTNRTDPVSIAAHLHVVNDTTADAGAASLVGFIVQGATAQAADLLVLKAVAGTELASFDCNGLLTFTPTVAGAPLDINCTSTAYTTAVGLIDVYRSGNITGVAAETMLDLKIAPTFTLTEPGSGTFTYYGASIDMSNVSVTAGAGTSVLAALHLKANADGDVGTNYALYAETGNINVAAGYVNTVDGALKPSYTYVVAAAGGDYTSVAAAVAAIGNTGGTVYVEDGTYTETSVINFNYSNTQIICSGAVTIQCNGAVLTTLVTATTGVSRIRIQAGKWLQTNATAQGTCFNLSDISDSVIEPTRIEEFGTAILIDDTTNATFYNRYRDIQIFNCNSGLVIGVSSGAPQSSQVNNNYFEAIRIRPKAGAGGYGIRVADSRGLTFVNCDCEPTAEGSITGISLETNPGSTGVTRECMFINCWVEKNFVGVSVAADSVRNSFIGCSITSNTTDISDSGTDTAFINTSKTGTTVGYQTFKRTTAGYAINVDCTSTAYTTALGLVDIVRSGNLTGVDTETIVDLKIAPAFTLTEPGAGTVNYYGASIDMSGLAVTAGGGTSVVSALHLKADDDADTGANYALYVESGASYFAGRVLGYQGADVASAGDTTLSTGNYFDITGSVTMNGIATAGWTAGSTVRLQFDAAPLVKHATAAGAGFARFQLAGAADFQASAGDTLQLTFDGTYWRETGSRVAI